MTMRWGVIGCGLIGHKRAKLLAAGSLIACTDADPARAIAMAKQFSCETLPDWKQLIARPDIDAVNVCTTHDALAPITLAAVQAGKHVLVEKPAALHAADIPPIQAAAAKSGARVRVGFNHRFHPAFLKARELVDAGELGELMFVRARYGHGGRVGYEKEWRFNPAISGGGQLIDQGMHLIDLSRWFLGSFPHVSGIAQALYWNVATDDNAFMTLQTADRKTAFLHTGCTEWKNLFSFEIFGKLGKLDISGLGGSYGVERITFYRMLPQMGPPETTAWEYPFEDRSWALELQAFERDIASGQNPCPGLADAAEALSIVESIYAESKK